MKTVWLVVAALCACAAGLGLWLGSRPPLTEGDVILRYAQRYVDEHAGRMEECHAVPGRRPEVWLVVLCEGSAGRVAYPVGRDGALVAVTGDEA